MKSIIIALSMLTSTIAMAADKLDGCGLGWQVTDKKSYTATTTRGTTNAFVPPTFGMTTGTMGCDRLDIGKNDKEAAEFVATNYDVLKIQLASGNGEYVSSLSTAMGCQNSAALVGKTLQQKYGTVVAPAQNSIELYKNIRAEVQGICI